MKKLFLLSTLLLALNLGAASKQKTESKKIVTITKQTSNKQTPSFLVRHANKLKNFSLITTAPLALIFASMIFIPNKKILDIHKKKSEQQIQGSKHILKALTFKFMMDILTLYAMNSKNAYLEQELKKAQTETVLE